MFQWPKPYSIWHSQPTASNLAGTSGRPTQPAIRLVCVPLKTAHLAQAALRPPRAAEHRPVAVHAGHRTADNRHTACLRANLVLRKYNQAFTTNVCCPVHDVLPGVHCTPAIWISSWFQVSLTKDLPASRARQYLHHSVRNPICSR